MRFKLSMVAAGVLTAIVILPGAALAACKEGFCVSGRDEGNVHVIQFSSTIQHVDHYNYNGGGGQRELGINETQVTIPIPSSRPTILNYSFQACNRDGGPVASSKCTPWVNFTHTVQ